MKPSVRIGVVLSSGGVRGVYPHIVRYYARIGLLSPSRDPQNGYQQFDQEDLARIQFIRTAQAAGFSLAAVGSLLKDEMRGAAECCVRTRSSLHGLIEDVRAEVVVLQSRLKKMEALLADWRDPLGCGEPRHCICPQIECVMDSDGE